MANEELEKQLNELTDLTKEQKEKISLLFATLYGLEVGKMKDEMIKLSDRLHELETNHDDLQRDVNDISDEIKNYSLADLDEGLEETSKKVEELEDRIGDLNERFGNLEDMDLTELSELPGKIDDLETDVADAKNSIEDFETTQNEMSATLDDLDSRLNDVEGKAEKAYEIESVVDDLQNLIEKELKKEFEELKINMVSCTELKGEILDLNAKFEDLNALIVPKPKEEEKIVEAIIEEEIKS